MERREFLGLLAGTAVSGIQVAEAATTNPKQDTICRRATTYRADCHGAPPTEPDDASAPRGRARNEFKKEAPPKKPAKEPPVDVDMCSALTPVQQKKSPICTPPKR